MVPSGELLVAFRLSLAINIDTIGVLPYTSVDGKIYVLMGQEEKSNKLTSFEGRVTVDDEGLFGKVSKNVCVATRNILSIHSDALRYSPALVMGSFAIIFSKIDPEFRVTARDNYLASSSKSSSKVGDQRETTFKKGSGITDIRWVSLRNLEKLMTGEKKGMKSSLQETLSLAGYPMIKAGLSSMVREE